MTGDRLCRSTESGLRSTGFMAACRQAYPGRLAAAFLSLGESFSEKDTRAGIFERGSLDHVHRTGQREYLSRTSLSDSDSSDSSVTPSEEAGESGTGFGLATLRLRRRRQIQKIT